MTIWLIYIKKEIQQLLNINAIRENNFWKMLMLKDKDATVRVVAAEVLGEMGPAAAPALKALTKNLKHRLPSVRKANAEALLGNLGAHMIGLGDGAAGEGRVGEGDEEGCSVQ